MNGDKDICRHPPCTCRVDPALEYCAPTCRTGIGEQGEPCKCGHAECAATTGDATV